jgi:hypothetical protein
MSQSTIQDRLEAVRQLMRLFMAERIAYLIVAIVSVAMLLYCGLQILQKDAAANSSLAGLFGSGGLISIGMGRLLTMWTQAMRLIAGEKIGD